MRDELDFAMKDVDAILEDLLDEILVEVKNYEGDEHDVDWLKIQENLNFSKRVRALHGYVKQLHENRALLRERLAYISPKEYMQEYFDERRKFGF